MAELSKAIPAKPGAAAVPAVAGLQRAGRRLQHGLAGLQYRLRLMPWPLSAGLGLLALSALGLVLVLLPQHYRLNAMTSELTALRLQKPQHPAPAALTPQDALHNFYQSLPPESAIPSLVAQLLQAAASQGITPEKAEYQLTRNSAAPLSLYQVTLPVQADYVALRQFIIQVLNSMPNAALSEISISRNESGDGLVSARLRFTLYLGRER